jgi:hypothetical protein
MRRKPPYLPLTVMSVFTDLLRGQWKTVRMIEPVRAFIRLMKWPSEMTQSLPHVQSATGGWGYLVCGGKPRSGALVAPDAGCYES